MVSSLGLRDRYYKYLRPHLRLADRISVSHRLELSPVGTDKLQDPVYSISPLTFILSASLSIVRLVLKVGTSYFRTVSSTGQLQMAWCISVKGQV
jgi:hypothetical protein